MMNWSNSMNEDSRFPSANEQPLSSKTIHSLDYEPSLADVLFNSFDSLEIDPQRGAAAAPTATAAAAAAAVAGADCKQKDNKDNSKRESYALPPRQQYLTPDDDTLFTLERQAATIFRPAGLPALPRPPPAQQRAAAAASGFGAFPTATRVARSNSLPNSFPQADQAHAQQQTSMLSTNSLPTALSMNSESDIVVQPVVAMHSLPEIHPDPSPMFPESTSRSEPYDVLQTAAAAASRAHRPTPPATLPTTTGLPPRRNSSSSVQQQQLSHPARGGGCNQFSASKECRTYINGMSDMDVLFFQGNRNHASRGAEIYLDLIRQYHDAYGNTSHRKTKDAVRKKIIDAMDAAGTRFVREERASKRYYLLTKKEAEKAISNSLWYASAKQRKSS